MSYAKSNGAHAVNLCVQALYLTVAMVISRYWPDQRMMFAFVLILIGVRERLQIDDRLYDVESKIRAVERVVTP